MTNRFSCLPALLTVLGLSAFALGCGGSASEISCQGNTPEAGVPDGQGEPSAEASPESSPSDAQDASPSVNPDPGHKACLSFQVSPALLNDPARWEDDPSSIWFPNVYSWASGTTLHVLWKATEKAPAAGSAPERLILSSFDPQTGAHLKSTALSPLPADLQEPWTYWVASDNVGNYAVLIRYEHTQNHFYQKLLLGKEDGSADAYWTDLPEDTSSISYETLGWDGEAFVLHGIQFPIENSMASLAMVRVAPDGTLKTAPTHLVRIHSIPGGYFWYSAQTQADTGRTLVQVADEYGYVQRVSVHEQDGSLVQGLSNEPWSQLTTLPPCSGIISFNSQGAMVEQQQLDRGVSLMPLNDRFLPESNGIEFQPDFYPDSSHKESPGIRGIQYRQNKWQWLVQHRTWLELQSWVPGEQPSSVHLFDYLPCPKDYGYCESQWSLYAKRLGLAVQGDNLWVGTWNQQPAAAGQPIHYFYQMMQAKDGCNYPTNQLLAVGSTN